MERDLAETVGQWQKWARCQRPAASGERKHSDCGQKTVRCWVMLEMEVDEKSGGEALRAKALCSKRLGDRGWGGLA